jgi:competence ComEA-like helix-hairpin-helix protein
MHGYQDEFEAFWNNDDVALTFEEAEKHKEATYASLHEANGVPYNPRTIEEGAADGHYDSTPQGRSFDINSFATPDVEKLERIVGKAITKDILKEVREFGRFDSWTEVLARVPAVSTASAWVREQLMENLEYGDGGLSINTANADELARAGLTVTQANALVAYRSEHGAFESLAELDDIRGISGATLRRIEGVLHADGNLGTYSARVPGGVATTGFSETHHGTLRVPQNGRAESEGEVVGRVVPQHRDVTEDVNRALSAPVIDMLRRAAPGQTFRMAMYGLSQTLVEFAELSKAAERGVVIRVVVYHQYNGDAIKALTRLRDAGRDVDLRIIKSRVMHEKFGVVGDDSFNGSANWSGSAISRNAEDRFYFRNQPAQAQRFVEEFARLWQRGSPA